MEPRGAPGDIAKLPGVRVLLSSTGGSGPFNPLVPVLEALERRNDEVLIVVPPGLEETVRASGYAFRIGAEPPIHELAPLWARCTTLPHAQASVIVEREIFGRLSTEALLPTVDRACREWLPELVLHETCEYASVVAAQRYGVAHAQVAISGAEAEAGAQGIAGAAIEPYGAFLHGIGLGLAHTVANDGDYVRRALTLAASPAPPAPDVAALDAAAFARALDSRIAGPRP